ncbi:hypothetical protein, partial [uncultured Selenomonas sp.]|uniref:hypothetical protein n=1 Tax=uncultured Selenomonas sp. TaxID=159275 RepID=UPI0028D3B4D9
PRVQAQSAQHDWLTLTAAAKNAEDSALIYSFGEGSALFFLRCDTSSTTIYRGRETANDQEHPEAYGADRAV